MTYTEELGRAWVHEAKTLTPDTLGAFTQRLQAEYGLTDEVENAASLAFAFVGGKFPDADLSRVQRFR